MSAPRISASTLAFVVLLTALPVRADAPPASSGWGITGAGRGELRSPIALALSGERVFVADFDNDRVQVFWRSGESITEWGTTGAEPGQFRGPAGVAVGPDGSVYVSDHYNHRVQRFAADGRYLSGWPVGDGVAAPFGIAVDARARVYTTDLDASRVAVWSSDGAPLATWGARGHGPGQMIEPWGIAVDGDGDVWVADHGNHRIQQFSGDGEWLGAWGEVGRGEGQLIGPMGLAIARDGSVYVTDLVGDRVRRFTRAGEVLARWGAAAGLGPSPAPGVALDAAGDLFFADPTRARIGRLGDTQVQTSEPAPTAFALMPIAQPMGRGPVTLELAIPVAGEISAEFFSIDGRRVHSVPSTRSPAGTHRITWDTTTDDGHRAPTGMYFVRVNFEDGASRITRTGRVIVLR